MTRTAKHNRDPFISDVSSASSGTFGSAARDFLLFKMPQLKPASAAKYRTMLDRHFLPRLADLPLAEITRREIVNLQTELLRAGLAPKTASDILTLLKSILRFAAREKGMPLADLRDVSVSVPPRLMRILSEEEQAALTRFLSPESDALQGWYPARPLHRSPTGRGLRAPLGGYPPQ